MYILKLLVILHLLVSTQIEATRKIFAGELPKDTKGIPSIVQIIIYKEPYVIGKNVKVSACGGSYIRPNWVISATHCITSHFPLKKHKPTYKVELCMGSVAPVFKCPKKLMRLADELHPYSDGPKWSDYDILLIKILKPWVIGPTIQITKLELPKVPLKSYNKKRCLIAGWGMTSVGVPGTTLRQGTVTVSVGNQHDCFVNFPDRQICAKGGTAITCQGDSGGPLSCNGLLVGVLDAGIGECNSTKTKTSMFNRINAYRVWIDRIAGRNTLTDAGNSIVPNKLCLCIFSIIPLAIFN